MWPAPNTGHLVEIEDLTVEFATDQGTIRALDGVSFPIPRGKSVGLVGESGCGKSVTALSLMRLIQTPPGKIVGGKIYYVGEDLLGKSLSEIRKLRGNRISMIFQEPMTSLNPVLTIGEQIAECFRLHRGLSRRDAIAKASEMLTVVQIPSANERINSYPHQLSGGMRQRVMIAMALCCKPDLLIADEPTTALDVTIQAQIMDLIKDLQRELEMSVLLITHDLAVVANFCENVIVMYAGKVVERASAKQIFSHAAHPYTLGLLNSVPGVRKTNNGRLATIPGMVPNLLHLPVGCSFQERCKNVTERCRREEPALVEISTGHEVSCFNPN